jgi:zinc protease
MTRKKSAASLGFKFVGSSNGIQEFLLAANGLRVVLSPNQAAPVVDFKVVYRCGSRNEGAGNTGSAHFFEHLMFKGTRKFDPAAGCGFDDVFRVAGGLTNAFTCEDCTVYFECVPADQLELCMAVEADRMRNLKNRKQDRDSEMTVVRNEFEGDENDPGSLLDKAVLAAAYSEHPYHHPVIGYLSDVEGIPMKRMVEFYDTYYWPNNATVIISGDFAVDEALALVRKHFGRIGRSPSPIPTVYTVEPVQQGERRVEVRRPGPLPIVHMVYHIPAASHADIYALAAAGHILGNRQDPASRLYKALVPGGLASSFGAAAQERRDPGLFVLTAKLAAGAELKQVEEILLAELERLAKEPVAESELARVKSANRKGTIIGSDDMMNASTMLAVAEGMVSWRYSAEYDGHYDQVTAADIQRVAATYFKASNRTAGWFIPTNDAGASETAGEEEEGSEPVANKPADKRPRKQRPVIIKAGRARTPMAPSITRTVMSNGLTLILKPNTGSKSVAIHGAVFAGDAYSPRSNPALADLTAQLLTLGSSKFSKDEIGERLGAMAVRLGLQTDAFKAKFGCVLDPADLLPFLDIVADSLMAPSFVASELATLKVKRTADFNEADQETTVRGGRELGRAIFPEGHPFRSPTFPELIASVAAVKVDDLRRFHAEHYSPAATIITVVGNIDPDAVLSAVQERLGSWVGPTRALPMVPPPVVASARRRIDINLPDKASTDIFIGQSTEVSRKRPDYLAALVAASALGADTISDRLGKVIRDEHGLTYGVYSMFGNDEFGAAPFQIMLGVNPANVDKALALVDEVVGKFVREGIGEQELASKLSQMAGMFTVDLRSNDNVASRLCLYEFMGLPMDTIDTWPDQLRQVTKSDVDQAIRKHLDISNAVTVVCGTPE